MWSTLPPQSRIPLSTLPVELLLIIAEFLPLQDVARLVQTSHFFANALEPYLHAHTATHIIPGKRRMVLDWAAERGQISILEKIRIHGKHTGDRMTEIPIKCKTRALSFAAKRGQTAAAAVLLSMGAEINGAVPVEDNYHFPALHRAARHGHLEMVTFLLDNGADLNIHGTPGESTVLEYAARWGRTETVLLLLSRGADIKTPSLIANAVFSENLDLVRTLLDRGAEINGSWHRRLSAIHWTMTHSEPNLPMLKLLLERGIDPHTGCLDLGRTVVHVAAAMANVGAMELLLQHGADPNLVRGQYQRPLQLAVADTNASSRVNDQEAVVRLLLDAGRTPLHASRKRAGSGAVALLEEATARALAAREGETGS
ncbi:ankyrin repeat-containing domain protein [Aspergillus varians]